MRMRSIVGLAGLAVVVVAMTSCGDVVRTGRSPVIVSVNSLTATTGNISDVVKNVTTPAPCSAATPCPTTFNDVATATLAVILKDTTATAPAPTANNQVTISRYHVEYRRTDGRNTPGVDVPFPIDGAVTATIAAGSTGAVGFELVRHTSKEESPLVQLINDRTIINTLTTVTFYGTDLVGNDVSASGTIQIDFGNFGDTP